MLELARPLRIQMLTDMDLSTIAVFSGIDHLDPGRVNLLVSVIDCNGAPVAGATIATEPPGTVRYFEAATPSQTATTTDATAGSGMIVDIPPGLTKIHATLNGRELRSHAFDGVVGR